MFGLTVAFRLHPGTATRFLPLVRANAAASFAEPGCLRFDVLVPEDGRDAVFLHEIYTDAAAFDLHLATPHFAAFDAATRAMVAAKDVRRWRVEWYSLPGSNGGPPDPQSGALTN